MTVAPPRTTAIVKLELTQTVYLELDVEPELAEDAEDDELDQKELMERATAAIYDGRRPDVYASASTKGIAAWIRGTACRPERDPPYSLRRCKTHGDLMSDGKSECWEVDQARYVGMEEERPQVAPTTVGSDSDAT